MKRVKFKFGLLGLLLGLFFCSYAVEIINKGYEEIFLAAEEYRLNKKGYRQKEPFLSQKQLPIDLEGWCAPARQKGIKKLIDEKDPQIIVEVGAWKGQTTVFFGINSSKTTKIYSIDLFGTPPLSLPNNFHITDVDIHRIFISNIKYFKLGSKIVSVSLDSISAAYHLDIAPDLVYIDGDHSEDKVCEDILSWHKKLSSEGVICGGSYRWPEGGVKRGTEKAAKILNAKVLVDVGFWRLILK